MEERVKEEEGCLAIAEDDDQALADNFLCL